jgi:hypothetical protein
MSEVPLYRISHRATSFSFMKSRVFSILVSGESVATVSGERRLGAPDIVESAAAVHQARDPWKMLRRAWMASGGRQREEMKKQEGGAAPRNRSGRFRKNASFRPAPLKEGWEPYGGGGAAARNLRRANLKHSPQLGHAGGAGSLAA